MLEQCDHTELTYCALVHFSLPRQGASDPTAPYQQYALSFTLIAAKRTGNVNEEAHYIDVVMTAKVTEIIRRVVNNQI